jgi:homoserine O-acetyltransferase
MKQLVYIGIDNYITESGNDIALQLSYQTFGQDLNEAPIVLVNHALTGNSNVCGPKGWWNDLIGDGKCIDTNVYAILAFNIPGNGYDEQKDSLIDNYKDFTARDVAKLFLIGLEKLNITELYALIGGSVGGGLVWELALLRPNLIQHVIPIAADWKSTDWVIANCFIQDNILNNSERALTDARMHAMTLYRTPESFQTKFNRTKRNKDLFNVESWLNYHGEFLTKRFQLSAYKMVNQILKTIDVTNGSSNFLQVISQSESSFHIIAIDSDLLFKAKENRSTFTKLRQFKKNVTFGEIKSIHGHDAFLIEHKQIEKLLKPVFQRK